MSPNANTAGTGRRAKPIDPQVAADTQEAVANLRARLIDLSRKSPLINFRHGGRSASILRIVDERPDLVFEAIHERGMRFEPLPDAEETPKDEQTDEFRIAYERGRLTDPEFLAATDELGDHEEDADALQTAERALRMRVRQLLGLPHLEYGKKLDIKALARANGVDPSFDLEWSDGEVEDHHKDDQLRVLQTEKELEKRLKSIWDRYRSHYRETGIHTLYMAFGFVEWRDDASDTVNHSPVLLLALELHREIKRSRYEYTLRPHDEGLQVNIALAEKMREHWGLEIPQLREDESPESYFVRLQEVLAKGRNLSLRTYVTLAVLPFPQMILWKDLDPDRWGNDAFGQHRLLPALMGVTPMHGSSSPAEPYNIDSDEWSDKAPALVSPADASQHSALIEAADGADLAIEGPPGTGKSQTITNLVADAVSRGKKILFVAEKQAALQVVSNRLREAGLGPLVLELHGENANRTQVYDGLRERLSSAARHDYKHLNLQRGRLKEKRERLRLYLARLRDEVGKLEKTVYELVWREIHLRSKVDDALQQSLSDFISCEDPAAVTAVALERTRGKLDIFGQALQALEGRPRTLWLNASSLDVFDQGSALRLADEAHRAAAVIIADLRHLDQSADLQLPRPDTDLQPILGHLEAFTAFDDVQEYEAVAALRAADNARTAMRLQVRWRRLGERLNEDLLDPQGCDRDIAVQLGAQLADLEKLPESVQNTRAASTKASRLAADAQTARTAADDLGALLNLPGDLPISAIAVLGRVLVRLGDQSAVVRAMMARDLLDPLSELAIAEQREAADDIAGRRDELHVVVNDETLQADPAELQQLADTLENSGFFVRLFGGEYKQAKRRSARLLRDAAERLKSAETLREAAHFRQSVEKFREESTARDLFPKVLWKGHDSDFEELDAARQALKSARIDLANVKLDAALDSWLRLESDRRDQAAMLASRFGPTAAEMLEYVDPAAPFAAAVAAIDQRQQVLARIVDLLDRLGVREAGMIVRDGEVLPSRLATFDACREEFEQLTRTGLLGWIEDVTTPLDGLGRALDHVAKLSDLTDPLSTMTALRYSERPVALSKSLAEGALAILISGPRWAATTAKLKTETGIEACTLARSEADTALHSWSVVEQALSALATDQEGAREAAKLLSDKADLDQQGLSRLCQAAINGALVSEGLADAYELHVVAELLRSYLKTTGADLQSIGGLNLADARRQFAKIDKELHQLEAQAILHERLLDKPEFGIGHGRRSEFTELALLEHELGLKRPRTPLREVVHRAGEAMQTLKPVWMMSPASAAQYIQPGSVDFDILIVDEASQMRPEFAISAVMRAKQFVVVGDTNQLPPSNHFGKRAVDDEEGDAIGIDSDAESILDVANQRFRRKRRLKWHYRSRHESLIKFSNREFYDDDLVVFPSPSGDGDELLGAKLIYVPDRKPGTYYASSINQKEAEAVLEEALMLMSNYPEYSLGIAAMNAQQAELLNVEFDRLRLQHPEINRYVEAFNDTVDEFFIKNLENVQGDERDIILVSTVYGPDKEGKVQQRFGLINQEVGWRRLNVLVTRAKSSIRVFTSLRPGDVKVTPTSSRGIKAFNAYLAYLNKHPTVDEFSAGEAESDFEWVVAERLREEGYDCVPQVGVNNFRIDMGVQHPECGEAFLAGIECDGAPFHSGFTVRDRDRIRQQVLEGLNWKIYRVWSVDWYQDPDKEMGKLLTWLGDLRDSARVDLIETRRDNGAEPLARAEPDSIAIKDAPRGPGVNDGMAEMQAPAEPVGRRLKSLDGIEWYETRKGYQYTVWEDDEAKGDVRVLSRTTEAPKLYGDRVAVQKSEYEAQIFATEETRKFNDIYAAVRFIGKVSG